MAHIIPGPLKNNPDINTFRRLAGQMDWVLALIPHIENDLKSKEDELY